jgi:hypothetical protein
VVANVDIRDGFDKALVDEDEPGTSNGDNTNMSRSLASRTTTLAMNSLRHYMRDAIIEIALLNGPSK